MSIWFKPYKLEDLEWMKSGTLMEVLGIELTELGDDYIRATMPIDHRTIQPAKLLHGGASAALAETIGSMGSNLVIDTEKYFCVGQNISAYHLRPGTKGYAHGEAKPVRLGKTIHLWDIEIKDDDQKLLCLCRLTMAVVRKKNEG